MFDASPTTVFNELLQNARRAGAKKARIHITRRGGAVQVEFFDDGAGMESPEPLLRLAGSCWNRETKEMEDPAGMGFFCLSNFEEVSVMSGRWSAVFRPEVFRGEEELRVRWDMEVIRSGTLLRWEWPDTTVSAVYAGAKSAAGYCGLESVEIDSDVGKEMLPSKRFLDDCDFVLPPCDDGFQIGIKGKASQCRTGGYYSRGVDIQLNFHGVRLHISGDDLSRELRQIGEWATMYLHVDVTRTGGLQLVLPARNALKHNKGRDVLMRECERAIYSWVAAKTEPHGFPFSVYQRAKETFYIDIGEADQERLDVACRSSSRPAQMVVAAVGLDVSFIGVGDLWEQQRQRYTLCRPKVEFEGYSWYDALPKLTGVSVVVDGVAQDTEEFFSCHSKANKDNLVIEWVDKIEVVWTIEENGSTTDIRSLPVAMAGGECTNWCFDAVDSGEYRLIVTKACKDDHRLLSAASLALVGAMFEESADPENEESGDEQKANFEAAMFSTLLDAVGDKQAAALCQMENRVRLSGIGRTLSHDEWAWALYSPQRKEERVGIVGPYAASTSTECWKVVTVLRDGHPVFGAEIHSKTPVTEERVRLYLQTRIGCLLETDVVAIAPRQVPVSLDASGEDEV